MAPTPGTAEVYSADGRTGSDRTCNQKVSDLLQISEVLGSTFSRTVTSGFRVAELAAGRQGAPLAGFFEYALLCHESMTRISQNIGGMGTFLVFWIVAGF